MTGQPKADAVLVEDGVILAVGTAAELQAMAVDGQQVDLAGKTMLPGFIDGHSHISQNGLFPKFDAPPIGTTDSVEQLIAQARAYLEKNPVQGMPGLWAWAMIMRRSLTGGIRIDMIWTKFLPKFPLS